MAGKKKYSWPRRIFRAVVPLRLRLFLKTMYHWGNRVQCTCCHRTYRCFLPDRGGENIICPNCRSYRRHRGLILYLQARTNLFQEPLKLLYFAPNAGVKQVFDGLAHLDCTTADLNSPLAQVHIDITKIPFEADSYDAIICNHVFEHIVDDRRAMRELFRILKPGGWAILQVPPFPKQPHTYEDDSITTCQDRLNHFGQEDHVRIYGEDYLDRLREIGFVVQADPFIQELPQETVRRHALNPKEAIYFCSKPG